MPVPTTTLDVDPLAKVLEPPSDETPAEREARLVAEEKARRISEEIDEELEREKAAEKKSTKAMKMLLLGQSESGKSTTIKNLQLMYDAEKFRSERASWKSVIQLNIVRSVHVILDALTQAGSAVFEGEAPSELLKLKMRLAPLLQVEQALIRRLSPQTLVDGDALLRDRESTYADRSTHLAREVAINSTCEWKDTVTPSRGGEQALIKEGPNDLSVLLNACTQDIQTLWNDPTVKTLLKKHKIHMEEVAGFFLDSLERVTALDYVPSDDDVLRARLKTLGVSEYRFKIKPEHGPTRDWRVFDVGGHRSLRSAWVPYFDDMDAIIFMAPVSAFDQTLSEDTSINRLEDSVNIWSYIVKNELLKHTNLILFMNKIDILKIKLESGIKFSDYVVSYGSRRERENDVKSVTKYLKEKFAGILREKSPLLRPLFCHLTTVTNFHATREILTRVRDILMRKYLEDAALL